MAKMTMEGKSQAEKEQSEKCFATAKEVLVNTPQLVIGIKQMQAKQVNAELFLQTTPELAKTLKTLPASLDESIVSENPILDMGISLNVPNVRDSLLAFLNYLGKVGGKHDCAAINKEELDKQSMGISMAMGMGITQVKSLYLAVNDLKLDENMQPVNADARVSMVADDPVGLFRMASMFVPPLAQMQIPDDGKQVALPAGLLPPGSPEVNLSRNGQRLDLIVGGSSELRKLDQSNPAIFWSSLDGGRYYNILADVMKTAPADKRDPEAEEAIRIMQSMSEFQPSIHQTIYPDDKGMVISLELRYP
jgi:hypothetical protein